MLPDVGLAVIKLFVCFLGHPDSLCDTAGKYPSLQQEHFAQSVVQAICTTIQPGLQPMNQSRDQPTLFTRRASPDLFPIAIPLQVEFAI